MERLAGKVMLMSGWTRALVAFLAGLFAVLALQPYGFIAALFVSFTVLVWLIDGASGDPDAGLLRRLVPAFRIGWCFGFGYFLGGLWWLGNALLVEADEYAWALPLAVLGLPAFLAFFYGFAVALARLFWSDGLGRILVLAAAFGFAEWLRSWLFTGFPWNAVGYGAMPVPMMMQPARIFGIAGMNVLAVFVFAAPALLWTGRGKRLGLSLAVLLLALQAGYGFYVLHFLPDAVDTDVRVRLVQPVIDQSAKLDDGQRAAVFEKHLALTADPPSGEQRPGIIVWPETSIPFILTDNPDALARIAAVLDDDQVLIAGAVRMEDTGAGKPPRYYNSIYAIDGRGQILGAADKVHLVPFGEYMPFEELFNSWGINAVAAFSGGFSGARVHQVLTLPGERSFYPLICYEAIFPREIDQAAYTTDALLNITNDAWFGDTPGPYQHFHQARVRAVETGLPLVRAANSGISAVVDAKGRVTLGLPYGMVGFVDATIPGNNAAFHDSVSQNFWFWCLVAIFFGAGVISRIGFRRDAN
ncbi:apolipoprotein N-acyltransferase [Rhizobium sp. ARZ01]|uniref:apolipoprotein N-acyltransferase n=1 Tax=Rhizobium sp. ARZ01 TaxID=2769313 RepID=UPI0017802553|nr:apolipoprotein N-acyltransferase [Rhizobium sp. ARZ01]MBD9374043.1 apolipoprotein N-acyltransferase [Rhizobium sp. ARZ01]